MEARLVSYRTDRPGCRVRGPRCGRVTDGARERGQGRQRRPTPQQGPCHRPLPARMLNCSKPLLCRVPLAHGPTPSLPPLFCPPVSNSSLVRSRHLMEMIQYSQSELQAGDKGGGMQEGRQANKGVHDHPC